MAELVAVWLALDISDTRSPSTNPWGAGGILVRIRGGLRGGRGDISQDTRGTQGGRGDISQATRGAQGGREGY